MANVKNGRSVRKIKRIVKKVKRETNQDLKIYWIKCVEQRKSQKKKKKKEDAMMRARKMRKGKK